VATLDVDASRPRHRSDPAVVALRERALAALGAGDPAGGSALARSDDLPGGAR
jgi:hypothetical protein